ncbi:MAG: DNA-binding LytR/AlgR family response regulator [Flavobacteriales bacterium]|jgi:DNA-binding LytR/AlgR family response regulator
MTIDSIKKHFLSHQTLWMSGIIGIWLTLNGVVLTTNYLLEARAKNEVLTTWEPITWEVSSIVAMIMVATLIYAILPNFLSNRSIKFKIITHTLVTLPFSAIHIAGMVSLRELVYWLMASDYQFGDWWIGFIYEYRKDLITYISLVFAYHAYHTIVLRLQGEAKYVPKGEHEDKSEAKDPKPEQLLVKKLGKEFLISIHDIEWVEAAGNYANLHVKDHVYPMRITMNNLEVLLPNKSYFRIHRSTIINLNEVKHIEALDTGDHLLTLNNGQSLNFSRRYRESFKDALKHLSGTP